MNIFTFLIGVAVVLGLLGLLALIMIVVMEFDND